MANLTLALFVLCAIGIWYAGDLYDNGKIRRFMDMKQFIEGKLLPVMAICAVLSFIMV